MAYASQDPLGLNQACVRFENGSQPLLYPEDIFEKDLRRDPLSALYKFVRTYNIQNYLFALVPKKNPCAFAVKIPTLMLNFEVKIGSGISNNEAKYIAAKRVLHVYNSRILYPPAN